ncbi:MAG: tetratricopeptide repeat protein, partial [Myxococcota bacterium]
MGSSDNVVAAARAVATAEHDPAEHMAALGRTLLNSPSDHALLGRLEQLAEDSGDWASLAHILRTVASRPLTLEQQVEVRSRLGRVYSAHLDEFDRAIATYRRVLDLSPRNSAVAAAIEALFVRTERWDDLADYLDERGTPDELIDVLVRHLPEAADQQASGYMEVARLCEQRLGQPYKAIEAAERALALDPTALDALRTLRRLYSDIDAPERCLDMLELELDAVSAGDERIAVLDQMIALCEGPLDDRERAAEYVQTVLLIDEHRLDRYRWLAEHFRAAEDWTELAECYQRHCAVEPDPEVRAELWRTAAEVYRTELDELDNATWALRQLAELCADELLDHERAAEVYTTILDLDPGDRDAEAALEQLYIDRREWTALADLLVTRAAIADRPADERAALRLRLADVYETRLGNVDAALAVYCDLLEDQPDLAPARAATERLLGDPAHALATANALEPLYRDRDEHALAIAIYTVLCAHAEPWQRTEHMLRIAELERRRDRPEAARDALQNALREDPADEALAEGLEQLAEELGQWSVLAAFYDELLTGDMPDETRADLGARLGRIYRYALDQPDRAVAVYRDVLALPSGAARAAEALEELYVHSGRFGDLL